MDNDLVNTIGLAFDIVGVLVVFWFGLAADVPRDAPMGFLIVNEPDETEERAARVKWRRYRCLSYLGLLLLVLGFILQIVSNYL